MFDGRVRIDGLALERPFGVAPSLEAGISLEDLDLQLPITAGAFSFGLIEGRLDGRIADLRLVDFSPVAFDAEVHTDPAYQGKRRISRAPSRTSRRWAERAPRCRRASRGSSIRSRMRRSA